MGHAPPRTAAPGTTTLTVTAGDKPAANLDIVVVDAPIRSCRSTARITSTPNLSADVCFSASGHAHVVGLPWTFTVDGVPAQGSLEPNCVTVSTTRTSGTIPIVGSAGGQSATLELMVSAMAREQALRPARMRPTTAGERAAM